MSKPTVTPRPRTPVVLKDLPDNPTIEDLQKFSESVLAAFGAVNDRSMLWTTMAAEIYKSIQSHLEDKKYTFAECVIDVEKAWQLYQASSICSRWCQLLKCIKAKCIE